MTETHGQHCPCSAELLAQVGQLKDDKVLLATQKGIAQEKLQDANLQIGELRAALVAECRGESCDSEECAGGGYRNCRGCEQRAKEAIHINPGDGSCMREVCGIHETNDTRIKRANRSTANLDSFATIKLCYVQDPFVAVPRTCGLAPDHTGSHSWQ